MKKTPPVASKKKSKLVPWFSEDSPGQYWLRDWSVLCFRGTIQSTEEIGLEGSKSSLPTPTRWSTRQARLLLVGFAWRTRANGHNVNQEGIRFPPQGHLDVETSCPSRVMHSLSSELCKPQLNKALSNLILSPWWPCVKPEVGLQAFWEPFQPE